MGRVARFEVEIGGERGEGRVAVYKDGPVFEVVVIDSAGQTRRDWSADLRQRTLRPRPMSDEASKSIDWTGLVRTWVNDSTRRVVRTRSPLSQCAASSPGASASSK